MEAKWPTKGTWHYSPWESTSKSIAIVGPDIYIYVDYDDVDHDLVDEALPRIIEALNREWNGRT